MLGFWLVIVLAILLLAALPAFSYSRNWGYYPSGILGLILLLMIFLMWFKVIAFAWPWGAPPLPPR